MHTKDIQLLGSAHLGCELMSAKFGGVLKFPQNASGVWTWSCPHLLYVVLGIRLGNRHVYWTFSLTPCVCIYNQALGLTIQRKFIF